MTVMKSFIALPSDFEKILSVDLQKDKKTALLINASAFVIAAIMFVAALPGRAEQLFGLIDPQNDSGSYLLRVAAFIGGLIVYMILHELVHGIAMHICGTKKVKYGFTGIYAFAGSDDYYDRAAYIFIALAPIAVWGIVLAVLCAAVPAEWFWTVYVIQIANISGAAGDLYVTFRFMKLPDDILVHDSGISMDVYSKTKGKPDGEN